MLAVGSGTLLPYPPQLNLMEAPGNYVKAVLASCILKMIAEILRHVESLIEHKICHDHKRLRSFFTAIPLFARWDYSGEGQ